MKYHVISIDVGISCFKVANGTFCVNVFEAIIAYVVVIIMLKIIK